MRNKDEIRLQRVVMALCAILFATFSFLFIAKYQSPLLELMYEKVSTGKLQYNGYVLGACVTIMLTLLALWLNRFAGFKREWTAFSFIPSILILSFITDIGRSLYTGEYNYSKWIVAFSVGLFAYTSISFVIRRVLFAKIKNIAMSANRIIWRNLILFVILFTIVGFLSNGDENFKRESLIASYYKKGDTDNALKVGYSSKVSSKTLTTQRAYILAKEGLLGDKLFEYPQYYGVAGLIPDTIQTSPLVPDSVFVLLGLAPTPGEDAKEFIRRAMDVDSATNVVKDYYLSALLLDKQIVEFVDAVELFYPEVEKSGLPKHYQEALILYESIDGSPLYPDKTELHDFFDRFKAVEAQHDDLFVRSNYVRREFGRTYWWYFLYGF